MSQIMEKAGLLDKIEKMFSKCQIVNKTRFSQQVNTVLAILHVNDLRRY